LYRQHVKLQDAGINVSRAWITKLMPAAVSLVEPIFTAQLESVRRSRVIAMDETPIKVGRAGRGKMKAAYFLLRGRSAACRPASGVTGASAHTADLEGDVC
jgi:fatty acid/phospholipid biosynthesis enzyme